MFCFSYKNLRSVIRNVHSVVWNRHSVIRNRANASNHLPFNI